jgi:hypothetical protein
MGDLFWMLPGEHWWSPVLRCSMSYISYHFVLLENELRIRIKTSKIRISPI